MRDAQGQIKAVLGDGLRLRDGEGQVRAGLRLGEDGAPFLELYDERGEIRAGFSLSEDGAGSLAFYDETGRPRAGMGSGQTGAMRMSFLDGAGHVRWQSGLEDDEIVTELTERRHLFPIDASLLPPNVNLMSIELTHENRLLV